MKIINRIIISVLIALLTISSISSLALVQADQPGSSYYITLTSVNGETPINHATLSDPITIAGTANGTNIIGVTPQYHIEVTWGDGIVETIPSWDTFITTETGFNGTWSTQHNYKNPGSYSIYIKLYHSQPPGSGGTADATFPDTGTFTIQIDSTTDLALSPSSSPQLVGTYLAATATILPNDATGVVDFQVNTPSSNTWYNFSTQTLSSGIVSASYRLYPEIGTYVFRACYSGDSIHKPSASSNTSMTVNKALVITIDPHSWTMKAGESKTFTAQAEYGTSPYTSYNWYVDDSSIQSSTSLSYTYNPTVVGAHTIKVTVTDSKGATSTDSASVTVNAGTLDHIVISPKSATIATATNQAFSTEAYDIFGNHWPVTATYSCPDTNLIISGNTVYSNTAGTYTITAAYSDKSDTATLTVNQPEATPTPTPSPSPSPNPSPSPSPTTAPTPTPSPTTSSTTTSTTSSTSTSTTPTSTNTKYTITFTEKGLPAATSWNITFNGQTKSSSTPTITFTGVSAGDYAWSTNSIVNGNQTTRYVVNGSTTASMHVPAITAQTISYKTQYYLTVDSAMGNPVGQGWYDSGATATFNVDKQGTDTSGTQYGFAGWTGTGADSYTGQDTTQTVTMNNPITETATWEQASSLYTVAGSALIIFLLLLLALLLLLRRRRKKKPQNFPVQELNIE